jgi:hypothetical protein
MSPSGIVSQAPGRIVEFIGVAGAGKSTLCRFAREELSRAGVRVVDANRAMELHRNDGFMAWLVSRIGRPSRAESRLDRRFRWLRRRALRRFRRRHHRAAALLESRFARMRAESAAEAELVRPWVRSDTALFELLGQSRASWSLCLWEEGIALRLVNLFAVVAETGDQDGLENFVSEWPLPDALAYVHVDLETAFERIEERGRTKRLMNATEEEVRRFLKRSALVIEAILAEARRRDVPIFELDNSEKREQMTSALPGWTACADGLIQLAGKG